MVRKTGDLLALGMFLFFLSYFLNYFFSSTIIQLIGISGAVIIILVELVFLWEKWIK